MAARQFITNLIIGGRARDGVRAVSATRAELRKLRQETNANNNAARSFTQSYQKQGRLFQSVSRNVLALGAAYLSVNAAVRTFNTLVTTAIDAEETANKFDVVMGPAAARLREEFEALTDFIPQTRAEMEGLSASIQDLLVPMGLARDEAADLSLEAVKLGADLASFNNIGADEALRAITSGLAGEAEPLRRYGVDVRVARLETIALTEGLIEEGEELDNTSRALAVFAAINRDSADAVGDAERTVDSTANQIKLLQRDLRQLAEDAGREFVPVVREVVVNMRELVEIGGTLVDNWSTVSATAKVVAAVLASRMVPSIYSTIVAQRLAIAEAARYNVALATMAGASRAAAAAVTAQNVALGLGRGAMALLGGPIGVVAAVTATAVVASRAYNEQLDALSEVSPEVAEALGRLGAITGEEWDHRPISAYRADLKILQNDLDETLDRIEQLNSGPELERQDRVAPVRGGSRRRELNAQRERLATLEREVEVNRELIRLREHLAGIDEHEDLGLALGFVRDTGEQVIGVLERLGIVNRNAAGGFGEMAEASDKIVGPLERQVDALREQLILLTEGKDAVIDYAEAKALAAAAEQDAEDGTTANVEAVRAQFAEIRALTGQVNAARAAQEKAAAAEQALRGQAQGLTTALQQLRAEYDPLGTEQARLNELLGLAQQEGDQWQQVLRELGITAADQGELVTLLQRALADLEDEPLKELEKDLKRIRETVDPNEAVFEQLREELENLQELFDAGFIDQDEFDRLAEGLKRALSGAEDLGSSFQRVGRNITGALSGVQSLFQQGSRGARAMEIAIVAVNTALGIQAILKQLAEGDVYSAIARAVAVAAMVASLGVNAGGISGGGSAAQRRQDTQGTGSVLGDATADSESIVNSSQITADATSQLVGLSRGMLRALQAMTRAIAGASTLIARGGVGGAVAPGLGPTTLSGILTDVPGGVDLNIFGFVEDAINSFLGFGKTKIEDQGIQILAGSIQEAINGTLFQAYVEVKKKGLFGTQRGEGFGDLAEDVSTQIGLIFRSMADTVFEAASVLGIAEDEILRRIETFQIEAQKISLEGLSGEEQEAAIQAVFSKIFDDLAGHVVPFIDEFQEVGEGLGETLVRVATSVQVVEEAVRRLGFAAERVDPEQFARLSVELVEMVGGIEAFINQFTSFFDKFASDADKLAVAEDELNRAFDEAGLVLPKTREEMWALMQSLDASTEAGRRQIATLLELADVADAYYRLLERAGDAQEKQAAEAAKFVADIENELANLTLSSLANETRNLMLAQQEAVKRAKELGLSEHALGRQRLLHTIQVERLAARLRESIRTLTEELFGGGAANDPTFNPGAGAGGGIAPAIDTAANQVRDALIRALEGVEEWLVRSQLTDPSLTRPDRLAATQARFDELVQQALSGDPEAAAEAASQLPQLADQLTELGAGVFGTATPRFQEFLAGIREAMEQVAGVDVPDEVPEPPPTFNQVGAIGTAVDQIVTSASTQIETAGQILDELGALSKLTGETPFALADELEVPLANVIGQLVDLGDKSVDTVLKLGAIADTLGTSLPDLINELDLGLGNILDETSSFSKALQKVISGLPEDIQAELLDPLNKIFDATSEADAKAAIADLEDAVKDLDPGFRNALAAFFEGVDAVDPTVGVLEQIRDYDKRQTTAAEAAAGDLRRILLAVNDGQLPDFGDTGSAGDIPVPGFATGGVVPGRPGGSLIRAGEAGRELVLPNQVTEFFARQGIPVNNTAANDQVVRELRELKEAVIEYGGISIDQRDRMKTSIDKVSTATTKAARINQSAQRVKAA